MVALLPRGLAGTKKGLDCLPAQTQFATLQIGLIGMQKASFIRSAAALIIMQRLPHFV